MPPYSLIEIYWHFGERFCLLLHRRRWSEGSNLQEQNIKQIPASNVPWTFTRLYDVTSQSHLISNMTGLCTVMCACVLQGLATLCERCPASLLVLAHIHECCLSTAPLCHGGKFLHDWRHQLTLCSFMIILRNINLFLCRVLVLEGCAWSERNDREKSVVLPRNKSLFIYAVTHH